MRCVLDSPYERDGSPRIAPAQDYAITSTTQIIYRPYVAGARGGLKAGVPVACRTPEEGIRRAERALAGGSILGAEVMRVTHDAAADEMGEPEYLKRVGRTPNAD